MGLSRDQAAHLLALGWAKDALTTLHWCLKDTHDFVLDFHDPWGICTEKGLLVYRNNSLGDIERAFAPPVDQKADTVAYTDGSGTTRDKSAGIGVAVYAPGRSPELIAENIGPGTNNRAELVAAWRALRAVPDTAQALLIRTDSEYVIGALTKDWVRNYNAELINNIRHDLELRPYVRFEHVDGHSGVEGNEVADRLSRIGRQLVKHVTKYEG
jgi:ribonuclease HI